MAFEQLVFRRQFIAGPRYVAWLPGWNRLKINDNLFITSHPDISVTMVREDQKCVVVLGFILDPFHPARDNRGVITNMLREMNSVDDIFGMVDTKGGRYVLIAEAENRSVALNDSAGFRELFYHRDENGNLWCASQPSLIAENCKGKIDYELRDALYSLTLFTKSVEYWYPGGYSIYKNIFHLLPNHYLCLRGGVVKRFWPSKAIEHCPFDRCVENVCDLLKGMTESALNRFDFAMAVTAGLDSRMVLSACRDFPHTPFYFTHTHGELSCNDPDITIPAEMLKTLGLNYSVIKHYCDVDPEFATIMNRNVTTARLNKIQNSYTMHQFFRQQQLQQMVVVNGVGGEMTRNFYFVPSSIKITGPLLAKIAYMNGCSVVEDAFSAWLGDAAQRVEKHNHVLDLFYWEQRMGNWAAMSYSEYDTAFESFSPLNCRKLVEFTMGVKPALRNPPDFRLNRAVVATLWPELLNWPINPAPNLFRAALRRFKRSPAHSALKMVKMALPLNF